jgi:preprotein translocase subunit YajC
MRKKITCFVLLLALSAFNNIAYSKEIKPVEQKNKDEQNKKEKLHVDVEKGISILAVSRNDIWNTKSKEGEAFSAKLVENIKSGDTVVIPSGSLLKGFITKIDSPQRFPCRDGAVYVAMSEMELPDGKIVNISESKIKSIIYSPYRKSFKKRFMESFPIEACYYGIMLPLTVATDMAGSAVTCISTGGALVAGVASGYILPEKGRSRTISAMNRGIDATPVGTVRSIFYRGESADIKSGDGLIVTFDAKTIQKIIEKRNIPIQVVEDNKAGFLGNILKD